jgi:ubiquinone biosynthesis protein COQ9
MLEKIHTNPVQGKQKMSTVEITPELFIEKMLRHVPFDGWSEAAMQTTAVELGLSESDLARLLPKGLASVIIIGADDIDTQMVAKFTDQFSDRFDGMPVHVKIRELLLIRFEILQPHKEAMRKMLIFLAKVDNAEVSSGLLYKTLDKVWRAAGDRSTDFNFYTKRATLGAVYVSTMLAFLDDDTPDLQKTRSFLERRLQDVARIPKVTKPLRPVVNIVASIASRIFAKSVNNT